jgi:hypothetical protein
MKGKQKLTFTEEELNLIKHNYETDIVNLQDQIVTVIKEKQQLNHKIELLQEELLKVAEIKIKASASSRVWAAITGFVGAMVALIMSIFDRNDK